jgi:uncharacterized membrane protein YheB (UPF0754 family)
MDSVELHFLDLMNKVNIKEVTKREINNMNPQEIEELFNSFAKKYFKKLENYGWLGGGIGLFVEMLLFNL